jgi:hypothetical protein
MIRKIVLSLSFMATLVLGGAVVMTPESRGSGAASINEIANPVNMVGETLRSTEVAGSIGWIVLAFMGLGLLVGHFAGGFLGMFVGLIGLGLWFGSKNIAETLGMTALGM